MKTRSVLLAASVVMALSTLPLRAATVTNIDDKPAAYGYVDLNATLALGGGTWTTVAPLVRYGNISGVTRSPFDNSGGAAADVTGTGFSSWTEIPYWAVGPNDGGTTGSLSFVSDQTQFNLLWGSIDSYNILNFYNDGSLVATVANTDISPAPGNTAGSGASYVEISDLTFDRVDFLSNTNAFEFASISVGPNSSGGIGSVPLPAALPLLLTALGGLGFFGGIRARTGRAEAVAAA